MMRLVTVTGAIAVIVAASPGWAHEEISPATIQAGIPVFLTLNLPNESRIDMTKVTVTPPPGLAIGRLTRQPAGWTAAAAPAQLTWTGGAVKPGTFEQFGFETEGADQAGVFAYKVTLGYSDGSSKDAEVAVTVRAGADAEPGPVPQADLVPSSDGRATTALGLSVLALVAGTAALVVAMRLRARGSTATFRRTPADDSEDW